MEDMNNSTKDFVLTLKLPEGDLMDAEAMLDKLVQTAGEQEFAENAAAALVSVTLLETAVPQSLRRFLPMISDGIRFLISKTPYARLKKILIQQLLLPSETDSGERLVSLAMYYPTLQKLGQIVARNRSLAPNVKRWLTTLEVQHNPDDNDNQLAIARNFLDQAHPESAITIAPGILAQASVASVIQYSHQMSNGKSVFYGVVKLLKTGIRDTLKEELQILDEALIMFENNRLKYGLDDMEIGQLFQAVRQDLMQEVDLQAEQFNLAEAAKVFKSNPKVQIPQLLEISSPEVTAMQFIDGKKITDPRFSSEKQRKIARLVFDSLICQPLFSAEDSALFHGDPHAGNIMVVNGKGTSVPDVALLDWTLAGHLGKSLRINLIKLIVAIQMADSQKIIDVLAKLSTADNSPKLNKGCIDNILERSELSPDSNDNPLRRSFLLLEELTMAGVVFPAELVLYRKAFFTLEGVLSDIAPDFDPGAAMEHYLGRLLVGEIPQRYMGSIFPLLDKASYYNSMISNQELGRLSLHHNVALWEEFVNTTSQLLKTQNTMTRDLLRYVNGFDHSR